MKRSLALAAAMSIVATTIAFPLTLSAATEQATVEGTLDINNENRQYQPAYGVHVYLPPEEYDPEKEVGQVQDMYGVPTFGPPTGQYVPDEVIFITEEGPEYAQKVAEKLHGELTSFEYGVGSVSLKNSDITVDEAIEMSKDPSNGLPTLSRNYINYLDDPVEKPTQTSQQYTVNTKVGDAFSLSKALFYSDTSRYKFTSTNNSIITVDANGNVTGVKEGSATIKITDLEAKTENPYHLGPVSGADSSSISLGLPSSSMGAIVAYVDVKVLPSTTRTPVLSFLNISLKVGESYPTSELGISSENAISKDPSIAFIETKGSGSTTTAGVSSTNIIGVKEGTTTIRVYQGQTITKVIDVTVTSAATDKPSPDQPEPEKPASITINRDKSLITLYSLSGETDEDKVTVPNDKIRVVAKTFTDKKLAGFEINGELMPYANGFELTLPESGSIDIAPVYKEIVQNEGYFSSISTHDSENTNIAVNSDEVSLFVDNKETYGGTVLNKKENKRLYFSINEDSSHGKIKSVRYNGQRIKLRGYFFINIDENSFDNVVIDIEYE